MNTRALLLLLGMASAQAEVVVVVSAKSPVAKLEKAQVVDLYLGVSKELPGAGQAQLLAAAPPLRDEFYGKVLGKEPSQVKAIWSRLIFSGKGVAPKELGSAADIKSALAGNPNAVAYLDKADVDASVKVVFSP
ncbi:phosphate ABC transporter substrate-binding protein [Inhella proteolytica]|uniref:Phosphate ABC transporter substrate-binding protein n=1 Tax=Inhella proteolytica TaxID=2795029 RepID=A0A931J3S0_9BURK|nr:phosphate ABC transporter substrate-binding protein [Inhella proteolytica]MBH9578228.1 phosphate ABC transporter substrate-binding protein [Inhella proteolytica]